VEAKAKEYNPEWRKKKNHHVFFTWLCEFHDTLKPLAIDRPFRLFEKHPNGAPKNRESTIWWNDQTRPWFYLCKPNGPDANGRYQRLVSVRYDTLVTVDNPYPDVLLVREQETKDAETTTCDLHVHVARELLATPVAHKRKTSAYHSV
jgi:hypothetical protein